MADDLFETLAKEKKPESDRVLEVTKCPLPEKIEGIAKMVECLKDEQSFPELKELVLEHLDGDIDEGIFKEVVERLTDSANENVETISPYARFVCLVAAFEKCPLEICDFSLPDDWSKAVFKVITCPPIQRPIYRYRRLGGGERFDLQLKKRSLS